MPSEIVVQVLSREKTPESEVLRFEVLNAEGKPAVRGGLIELREGV
jgi:hypothetical protein